MSQSNTTGHFTFKREIAVKREMWRRNAALRVHLQATMIDETCRKMVLGEMLAESKDIAVEVAATPLYVRTWIRARQAQGG